MADNNRLLTDEERLSVIQEHLCECDEEMDIALLVAQDTKTARLVREATINEVFEKLPNILGWADGKWTDKDKLMCFRQDRLEALKSELLEGK